MPTITAEVDFDTYCSRCGAGICNNVEVRGNKVYVDPCEKCLEDEYDKGFDNGREEEK